MPLIHQNDFWSKRGHVLEVVLVCVCFYHLFDRLGDGVDVGYELHTILHQKRPEHVIPLLQNVFFEHAAVLANLFDRQHAIYPPQFHFGLQKVLLHKFLLKLDVDFVFAISLPLLTQLSQVILQVAVDPFAWVQFGLGGVGDFLEDLLNLAVQLINDLEKACAVEHVPLWLIDHVDFSEIQRVHLLSDLIQFQPQFLYFRVFEVLLRQCLAFEIHDRRSHRALYLLWLLLDFYRCRPLLSRCSRCSSFLLGCGVDKLLMRKRRPRPRSFGSLRQRADGAGVVGGALRQAFPLFILVVPRQWWLFLWRDLLRQWLLELWRGAAAFNYLPAFLWEAAIYQVLERRRRLLFPLFGAAPVRRPRPRGPRRGLLRSINFV